MDDAIIHGIGHEDELWQVLEWAGFVILAIAGLLMKVLWSKLTKLSDTVVKLQLEIANEYVKEDDFKDAIGSLKTEFHDTIKPLCDRVTLLDDFLRRVRPAE